jgi:hypothetical protein
MVYPTWLAVTQRRQDILMSDPKPSQDQAKAPEPDSSRYEPASQWLIWVVIFVALLIGFLLS